MQKLCALFLSVLLFAACSKNTSIEVNGGNNNNNNNGGNNNGNGGNGGNNGGNTGGNTNTSYYIKFSLDGAAKDFETNAQALMTSAFGATILTFVASPGGSSLENMQLIINNTPSDNPIKAGTYSETDILNYSTTGVYSPGTIGTVYAAGVTSNPSNPLKIVITSIDDKTATGTFSGDLIFVNTTAQTIGPGKKTITNGQFNLPIVKQ